MYTQTTVQPTALERLLSLFLSVLQKEPGLSGFVALAYAHTSAGFCSLFPSFSTFARFPTHWSHWGLRQLCCRRCSTLFFSCFSRRSEPPLSVFRFPRPSFSWLLTLASAIFAGFLESFLLSSRSAGVFLLSFFSFLFISYLSSFFSLPFVILCRLSIFSCYSLALRLISSSSLFFSLSSRFLTAVLYRRSEEEQ